jgi:hypothetical protein
MPVSESENSGNSENFGNSENSKIYKEQFNTEETEEVRIKAIELKNNIFILLEKILKKEKEKRKKEEEEEEIKLEKIIEKIKTESEVSIEDQKNFVLKSFPDILKSLECLKIFPNILNQLKKEYPEIIDKIIEKKEIYELIVRIYEMKIEEFKKIQNGGNIKIKNKKYKKNTKKIQKKIKNTKKNKKYKKNKILKGGKILSYTSTKKNFPENSFLYNYAKLIVSLHINENSGPILASIYGSAVPVQPFAVFGIPITGAILAVFMVGAAVSFLIDSSSLIYYIFEILNEKK